MHTSRSSEPLPAADPALHATLLDRLYALPFDAFARCVCARMGYVNVRPAGRGHYRGSNQHRKNTQEAVPRSSGYDLVADLPAPEGTKIRRFAVASLKQFPPRGSSIASPARVFQRQVDEARGASLRAGASVALLITTGAVSPTVAHKESLPLAPIASICVIDGEELARLCVRSGVGVVPAEDGRHAEGGEVQSVLDAAFFDLLARSATGNGPADFTHSRNETKPEKKIPESKHDGFTPTIGSVPPLTASAMSRLRKHPASSLPLMTLSVRVSIAPNTDTPYTVSWEGGSR